VAKVRIRVWAATPSLTLDVGDSVGNISYQHYSKAEDQVNGFLKSLDCRSYTARALQLEVSIP
jgi:uncharacterized protein YjbK